jgi:hypothetical protein
MDDFSISTLYESKNEWGGRLITILTPLIIDGYKSIFEESIKLCKENNELDKYLMTFQNFLTRVPKWNTNIIETEKTRIVETSGCTYLEELITCVHVIQLKILTCVRVGSKQKKLDINVPSVNDFIHKIYIHVARKIYTNIYLFEKNIAPLLIQKNNREVEITIKECILNAIRDSVPVEHILRAYMDETEEQDVEVKEVEEPLPDLVPEAVPQEKIEVKEVKEELTVSPAKISFSNDDTMVDVTGNTEVVNAPKDEKNLEELEKVRALAEKDDDDDEEDERLTIGENIKLDIIDINDLSKPATVELKPPVLDFEILT